MGTSATKAKAKYNSKNYEKITLTLSPILAENFKKIAQENELSQPQFLQKLLDFFVQNKQILDDKNNEIEKLATEKNKDKKKINDLLNEKSRLENAKIRAEKGSTEKMLKLQTQNIYNIKWFCGACLAIGCILGAFLVLIFTKLILR